MPKGKQPPHSIPFMEAIQKAVRKDLERVEKDPTVPPRVKESLRDFKPPKI